MDNIQTPRTFLRRVFCVVLAAGSLAGASPVLAQTCAAGVRASNPSSAYIVTPSMGTVVDTRTGLMWDRCVWLQNGVNCTSDAGTAGLTWLDALGAPITANAIHHNSYSDWRLPNVKELRSLVEECRISPSINEWAFPNTPATYYWTNSPSAKDATAAWEVSFGGGFSAIDVRTATYRVRLVRGGY